MNPDRRPSRALQACTACATRKVRCNGKQPCRGCSHLNLSCVFRLRNASSSRSQSKRGGVISSLKPRKPAEAPLAIHPIPLQSSALTGAQTQSLDSSVDQDFLRGLLGDYRSFVYPVCPIIHDEDVRESIDRFGTEADHGAFSYAYAAVTLALGSAENNPHKTPQVITKLVSRAIQLRPVIGHRSQISLKRVVFSVFLRIVFGVLQDREMDFFYLRESTTMLQMLQVDGPHDMDESLRPDRRVWKRLHWVIFIQERVSCIGNERPATLRPPASLQMWEADDGDGDGADATPGLKLPSHVRKAFVRMGGLYRLVDEQFLAIWRDKQDSPLLTLDWVTDRQGALAAQHRLVEVDCPSLGELQQADLVLTSQWLRTLVWQMAGFKYMLHSDARQDYMRLLFPVQGSVYVGSVLRNICHRVMEQQGVGNLQKLFEITNTAADVLGLSANPCDQDDLRWIDNCRFLIRYSQQFKNLHGTQRYILQQKLVSLDELVLAKGGSPTAWQSS